MLSMCNSSTQISVCPERRKATLLPQATVAHRAADLFKGATVLKNKIGQFISSQSLQERFWSKVNKNGPTPAHMPHLGPCWLWTAGKELKGYGRIRMTVLEDFRMEKAHRAAWILCRGDIPDGLFICHHCDNPPCVNPTHLFPGTHQDNMLDCIAKVRRSGTRKARCGMRSAFSKITDDQVRQIRESKLKHAEIAANFGISRQHVGNIKTGERRSLVRQ